MYSRLTSLLSFLIFLIFSSVHQIAPPPKCPTRRSGATTRSDLAAVQERPAHSCITTSLKTTKSGSFPQKNDRFDNLWTPQLRYRWQQLSDRPGLPSEFAPPSSLTSSMLVKSYIYNGQQNSPPHGLYNADYTILVPPALFQMVTSQAIAPWIAQWQQRSPIWQTKNFKPSHLAIIIDKVLWNLFPGFLHSPQMTTVNGKDKVHCNLLTGPPQPLPMAKVNDKDKWLRNLFTTPLHFLQLTIVIDKTSTSLSTSILP